MALQLYRFANGDTNYVVKHNQNAELIEGAANSLRNSLEAGFGAAISLGAAFQAMFGTEPAVIGKQSFACTGSGTVLTVAPGFVWLPSINFVIARYASATLDFAGVEAGLHYVTTDGSGTPIRTTNEADALYSVSWSGTTFGDITLVANVIWGAADQLAAQSSASLGATYDTLDGILEALGSAASAGAKPYIPEIKAVAYGASITADFSDCDVIRITLTGNPTITLAGAADGQKCVIELTQDATGSRTVTWSANVRYGTDLPSITLSTAGGALDRVGLVFNAAASKFDVVALSRGF